jgi:NADPH:quinone reductase-like Zn-dependent oxidoreductase
MATKSSKMADVPEIQDRATTMQAMSQNELGGPDVLQLATLPVPEPGLAEVLVRVRAASVNPIDGVNRETGALIGKPPFVLGWDISGAVEAVGPGVTVHSVGDEVFGMLPFPQGHGAYAEYAVSPALTLVRKPQGLDHVEAAAIPMVGLTAWQSLVETAEIGKDSRVFVDGAAGGIGHLAVQIAKARGARVTALASAADADFVRSIGADEAIDYATTDFAEAVRDQDVVLDVLGDDSAARALKILKPGGVLVSSKGPSLVPLADEAAKRGVRLAGPTVQADRLGMASLADLVNAGKLRPTIAATFPLAEAGVAESHKHGPGKVVLTLM